MIESPTVSLDAKAEDKRNILLVFAGLMVTMLLASLDQMIFSTALPTIVGELNGVDHMLWVTTAYILASTIMLPIYGNLGDLIGGTTGQLRHLRAVREQDRTLQMAADHRNTP